MMMNVMTIVMILGDGQQVNHIRKTQFEQERDEKYLLSISILLSHYHFNTTTVNEIRS